MDDPFSNVDVNKLKAYLNSLEGKAHMARLDAERKAKKVACTEQGHPNKQESGVSYFRNQPKVYWMCPDCNEHGARGLTMQEEREFIEHMRRPFGAISYATKQ